MGGMRSKIFKIILLHAAASIVWIAISDLLVTSKPDITPSQIIITGSASAALYVLVTCVILYKLITMHYRRLVNNEKQYRSYFENNPNPMWIYDRKSLKFLAVNDSAISNYGYSREEFYNMTILDIRLAEETEKVLNAVNSFESNYKNSGIWNHRRKDGTDIYAQITSNLIFSKPEQQVMIMAADVTKRLQTEMQLQQANAELIRQNNTLREISWSQSHNVRRPLSSILGLLDVFRFSDDDQERELCINYIEISAAELDIMIQNLNHQINNAVVFDDNLQQQSPAIARL